MTTVDTRPTQYSTTGTIALSITTRPTLRPREPAKTGTTRATSEIAIGASNQPNMYAPPGGLPGLLPDDSASVVIHSAPDITVNHAMASSPSTSTPNSTNGTIRSHQASEKRSRTKAFAALKRAVPRTTAMASRTWTATSPVGARHDPL